MADRLANQIANKFIQRKDVKAVQYNSGGYTPVREGKEGPYLPWGMPDVEAHLAGTHTFGHYLVDQDDKTRLFCFDIDLTQAAVCPTAELLHEHFVLDQYIGPKVELNPREAWRIRHRETRPWLKWQLGFTAAQLATAISKYLDLPVAAAYSGSKGVHVYAFTGEIPASEARAGAQLVLASLGCFELERGSSLYRHVDQSVLGFPCINVEVYPKQESLADKTFGNLLRLPLGRNLKSPTDPTFFVDLRERPGALAPHPDPYYLLKTGNPWR